MSSFSILAFAAHPDDVELSCSGTLLKHKALGHSIGIVDLTKGELGTRGDVQTRKKETEKASEYLSLDYRKNLSLSDGYIEYSKENLYKVITEIRFFHPNIILCNAPSDRHCDHGNASKLVREASFLSGLQEIKVSQNNKPLDHWRPKIVLQYIQDYYHEPSIIIDTSEYMDKKIEVISLYKSQFFAESGVKTPLTTPSFFEFIRGRDAGFGRRIGKDYGEGFLCERTLGTNNLEALL